MSIFINKEIRNLIPPLSEEELQQLEENIVAEGIRDPLVTWPQPDGREMLIDGHNRFDISCRHNGIPFEVKQMHFESMDDAKMWMIKNQFGRRNLNSCERSELAIALKPLIEKKAKERQTLGLKSDEGGRTDVELGKIAGVGKDTIRKVEVIMEKATPEIREKARKGEISINQAYKAVKEDERKAIAAEKEERKAYSPEKELPPDMCRLYTANIRNNLPMVEDNSIDFIITDPPYPKEYLVMFTYLSRLAARTLKPGGSLLVMSGQSYLPEVIKRLSEDMQYHWCLSYETPGGQSPQLFQKKVNTFWKPVLWFTKGKYAGDWVGDTLKSAVNDNDKRYHEWGQSVSGLTDIVSRFCYPGDTILDPFLGGGTTGVAAVLKGCKFIGADIESENVKKSEERIREAYINERS